VKKIKTIFCCTAFAAVLVIFLLGCADNAEHLASVNEDIQTIEYAPYAIEDRYPPVEYLNSEHTEVNTWPYAYQNKQVMSLTLGADSVFVEGAIVKIPDHVTPDEIYDVSVKHMGDIDSVLSLAIWDSVDEAENLLFSCVFNNPIYLVLEIANSAGDVIGHSLTNSRIDNAISYECYTVDLEEIVWYMVWNPDNAVENPCGCWGVYCSEGCIVIDSNIRRD